MAFDQSVITEVFPPVWQAGQVWIRWTSSAPPGTWFQVYYAGRLAWWTQDTRAAFPVPDGPRGRFDVGAVGPGEYLTDFSAAIATNPATRARLRWTGGTYEDPLISGYYIYGEPSPGAGVDYSAPVATIPCHEAGIVPDGFGQGGFGQGGFGFASSSYEWVSEEYTTGTWTFAVVPFDLAGNLGTARTAAVAIKAPPLPPARDPGGKRLRYSYSPGTRRATLAWLPGSGCPPPADDPTPAPVQPFDLMGLM